MVIASLLILSGILFGLQNFSTDKNKESINFLPFVDTVFAKITRSFTTEFPPNSFTINFCGYGYSIMYIPEGEEYIILRGARLIKTDEYGNEIWNRNFNKYVFRGRSDNYGFSVMQTSDGGYIIVGLSFWLYYDYDHEEYIWLIKTDAYGNETWNRIFDYEYSEHSVTWLKQLIEVANNHRPIVIITYPTNGTTVNGIVTIQGSASDEDGDETIQKVEVKIDNGKWLIATGTLNWAYTLDTTKLENGNHTIYARSYDGKEYSKIASITVEVKNQKEEIGIPGFEMIALFAAVLTVVARKRVKEK